MCVQMQFVRSINWSNVLQTPTRRRLSQNSFTFVKGISKWSSRMVLARSEPQRCLLRCHRMRLYIGVCLRFMHAQAEVYHICRSRYFERCRIQVSQLQIAASCADCFRLLPISDGKTVSVVSRLLSSPASHLEQLLKYKDQFLSLLHLLRDKTFSKRGYAWTGKLLSSMLLTLSHTYPLENRFVNPDEWESEGALSSSPKQL
jgi:hypothetical protein